MALTEQQEQAATNRGGNLLVSAAAGSGKTKVLVERLMLYLTDRDAPANIDDFLIITYTKAAAAELRSKIADVLNERIAASPENRHLRNQLQRLYLAKISTVHSFCAELLREQAYRLDIPADFRIAEEKETDILRQQVLDRVLDDAYGAEIMDPDFQAFIDSQEMGKTDRNLAVIILNLFDIASCHKDPSGWLTKCLDEMNVTGKTDALDTIWGRHLFDDLQDQLALNYAAMSKCVERAKTVAMSDKPVAIFQDDIHWLSELMSCKSWDDIVNHREHDFATLRFSGKFGDPELRLQMKAIRETCKDNIRDRLECFTQTSSEVLEQLVSVLPSARGLIHLVETFMQAFAAKKRQLRIMDYSDLEHMALDLLVGKSQGTPTTLAKELSERFREIMVDEFQDSNEVQDGIFQALTCHKHNCFMVGDVKQSIYQFRLADPDIFLRKFETFPDADVALEGEGRKVLLSKNFRSSEGVIEAVNHICNLCMSVRVGGVAYTEKEWLYAGRTTKYSGEPDVEFYGIDVAEDTYREESAFVAKKILELTDGTHYVNDKDCLRPIVLDDIAIILRSPGSVGIEFLSALREHGIPAYMEKDANLLLTEEISTLRSFLQVINNPQLDIPLVAVLTSRIFCFNASELAEIRVDSRYASVFDSICASQTEKAKAFIECINHLRQYARIHTLSELILEIFHACNFDSIFAADQLGSERMENLQSFCKLLSSYESTEHKTLAQLLDYLDTLESKGISPESNGKPSGTVEILSIHHSKGLEYPVVFLSGLSRNFNTKDAYRHVLRHKRLGLGLSCFNKEKRIRYPSLIKNAITNQILSDNLSQEMLVLYVAMTRARDRLIMTYAVNKLEERISDTVHRMDLSDPLLMTTSVKSPGDWVLYSVLHRSEAGALFQLGGYPECREVTKIPWHIDVVDGGDLTVVSDCVEASTLELPAEVVSTIAKSLSFSYPHRVATEMPSKLTATELKGRCLDEEVAQNTQASKQRRVSWERSSRKPASGAAYGTALHAVMQYIRYDTYHSVDDVREELKRLVAEQFISKEQADAVDAESILKFFASDIGKLALSSEILREFKFTILQDASQFFPNVVDDKVLLQGVVDLAVFTEDGIIVVDFKTDRLTEDTIDRVAQGHFAQVRAYSRAIEEIYQQPVKKSLLYFFGMNEFVEVP